MINRKLSIFLFILWNQSIANANESENPIVCIKNDFCIRGVNFKGNQKPFEGFLAIPYAKPPIHDLRLKDPEPIDEKEMTGTYNATETKMFCIQKNYLIPNPKVMGVEDCLHLYVYRPKSITKMKSKLLPVIVYIHGGGFFAGTGAPTLTGADYFMDSEDVIFVTMNYRLGPLGFLSTGDKYMPGNFALKDQAMAIKWTKDNIRKFGGDEENISLMGQSAGAASVQLHMMSKWSQNMFHRSVILSGNGNGPYAYVVENPLKQAKDFAKYSNIENVDELDSKTLAEKLRSTNAEDLINACDHMRFWSVDSLTISRPVVEDCRSKKGFLCADPIDLWKDGQYSKIPILSGFMDGDGGVRALAILSNKTDYDDLNNRFFELIPKVMEVDSKKSSQITKIRAELINKRYFLGKGVVRNDTDALIKLYTDRSFITPQLNMMSQLVKKHRSTPAYMYKFSFHGRLSYANFYTGSSEQSPFTPVHCDDLIYLLHSPWLFPNQTSDENSAEGSFRKKFVKFFTSFAATGVAQYNGKSLPRCRYSSNSNNLKLKCQYIEFINDKKVSSGELDPKIAEFWNSIDDKVLKRMSKEETRLDNKHYVKIESEASDYMTLNL